MKRSLLLLAGLCLPLFAQTMPRRAVRSWFADGTGLEIYTETTGPTRSATQGVIGISYDKNFRLVTDRDNNVLFGYYLDGHISNVAGAEYICISPVNPSDGASLGGRSLRYPSGALPTVAAVREFPAVKIGEAVTLDILLNPSTGERIYDVIRPITAPSPATVKGHPVVTGGPAGEQLSLKEITVRVNGRAVDSPGSWLIGAAGRIDIPGHGTFILAAADPNSPRFHPTARAEGASLSWNSDGDRIEITSKTNVLVSSESGPLWIYRENAAQPVTKVRLQTADSVDWLLPNP